MNNLQRSALIITLIEGLEARGSWCGETHIQKAAYFAQELLKVPLGFNFILYKHGPFSFELSAQLTSMRADGLLRMVPKIPYGPSILPNEDRLKRLFPKTLAQYKNQIDFVVGKLGTQRVAELERLATALYVTLEDQVAEDARVRAERINELKPHVLVEDALEAVKIVDEIICGAKMVKAS